MAIRDRGKLKWQSAFAMPEHMKMLSNFRKDYMKVNKPILDECQIQELEENIHLAAEYNYRIIVTIWRDGFCEEITGQLRRLDGIHKRVHLFNSENHNIVLHFNDIVKLDLEDK